MKQSQQTRALARIPHENNDIAVTDTANLRDLAAQVRAGVHLTTTGIRMAGAALNAAKEQLPHGQFQTWVENECGLAYRTAVNYMHGASLLEMYPESETVALLPPKALYALAAPSMPPAIAQWVAEGKIENTYEAIQEAKRIYTKWEALPYVLKVIVWGMELEYLRKLGGVFADQQPRKKRDENERYFKVAIYLDEDISEDKEDARANWLWCDAAWYHMKKRQAINMLIANENDADGIALFKWATEVIEALREIGAPVDDPECQNGLMGFLRTMES